MGKFFIFLGVLLIVLGFALTWNIKLPSWLGKLPGDIVVKKEHFQLYFPVTTCILVSILATIIFSIFRK